VLIDLTASARRLALVGLAKNTGKTEALAALLRELSRAGRRVGVTSVGRDGEEHDVIDFRIDKPRVNLPAQSLLATTDSLLSVSGVPFELMTDTGIRTPLGRVLIVRLKGAGAVEVAGPSAAHEVREVSDAMLDLGAEQVLIDGAIDRRAASRPDVADGLIMSTGAVLAPDIGDVVQITRRAVELVRLPTVEPASPLAPWLAERLAAGDLGEGALVGEDLDALALPARFALSADGAAVRELLARRPSARSLVVGGALPEAFLAELVAACRPARRSLTVVVADSTRVFLAGRDLGWYEAQGVEIAAVSATPLLALTVNPLAPQSHTLDSLELRGLLGAQISGVPIFDVLAPDYAA
jgi:hypothetical protein